MQLCIKDIRRNKQYKISDLQRLGSIRQQYKNKDEA